MKQIRKICSAKSNQDGYTMLELLLVVGIIIALASIMVYSFLSRVNKQSSIDTAAAQVSNIVTAERTAVRQGGAIIDFASKDQAKDLITYGLEEKIANGPETANPWGGAYTVTGGTGNGSFIVEATNLPSSMTGGDEGGSTDYQNFVKTLNRLGEGNGATTTSCTTKSNTLTCTFDNQ